MYYFHWFLWIKPPCHYSVFTISEKIVCVIKSPILTQILCYESLVDFHESLNCWFSGGCRNWPGEARRHEIQHHFRRPSLCWFLSTGHCLFRPSWIRYCHWCIKVQKLNIKAAERFSFLDLGFLTVKVNTRKDGIVASRCTPLSPWLRYSFFSKAVLEWQ